MKQARIGTERDESVEVKSLDMNATLPLEGTEMKNAARSVWCVWMSGACVDNLVG